MTKQPLVSIIIPTFNRAHLIGETLNSVMVQTYTNWECIVVDDGSDDETEELLNSYIAKDSRIQYHKRPNIHLPGGNGARNYGFKVSKGEFIQWFDSDDLMVPEKIEIKIKIIQEYSVDFVISKTRYFNKVELKPYEYNYHERDVNFLSYSTTYISWFTPDMFLKRMYAEKVSFNEVIKAGQEYNFACKLLLETNNLKKIDVFLTLRRFHKESIGRKRQLDRNHYWETTFNLHWVTWHELKLNNDLSNEYERYVLLKCAKAYLMHSNIKTPKNFHNALIQVFGVKTYYLYIAKISKTYFGKYFYFYKKFKKE